MSFVNARIMRFWSDIICSNCVAASFKVIYIRYATVGEIMMMHGIVLSLFVKLSRNGSAARVLAITYLHESNHYISSQENFFLIIREASTLVQNHYIVSLFQANSFHSHVTQLFIISFKVP